MTLTPNARAPSVGAPYAAVLRPIALVVMAVATTVVVGGWALDIWVWIALALAAAGTITVAYLRLRRRLRIASA